MKLIIDIIEDIRTAINNDGSFSLTAMGLTEQENGEFTPSWESNLCSMKLDDENKRLYLFLGKEKALAIGNVVQRLDALSNKKMMYEICISYSKENKRLDSSILGFGESLEDKRYLLFISE